MSGGSFDYLHSKEIRVIMGEVRDLTRMRDLLMGVDKGFTAAGLTAADFTRVLEGIDALAILINELRPMMQAVEWWQSADWNEDDVREACVEHQWKRARD